MLKKQTNKFKIQIKARQFHAITSKNTCLGIERKSSHKISRFNSLITLWTYKNQIIRTKIA